MSIESLGQLESRLQNLIDKLELSRMELEELKVANNQLEKENAQLKQEHSAWGDKVSVILGKLNRISDDEGGLQSDKEIEKATF